MAPLHLVKVREWRASQPRPCRQHVSPQVKGCAMWLSTQPRTILPPFLPPTSKQASERARARPLPFVAVRNPSASGILPSPQRSGPTDQATGRTAAWPRWCSFHPWLSDPSLVLGVSLLYPLPCSLRPSGPYAASSPSDENASILTRLRPTALRHPHPRSLGQNYCKARSDGPSRALAHLHRRHFTRTMSKGAMSTQNRP